MVDMVSDTAVDLALKVESLLRIAQKWTLSGNIEQIKYSDFLLMSPDLACTVHCFSV